MKKGFFYLLHIIILSAFLCTNVIQADLLAPSTNLPVLYSDAQVDYIALDVISTLSSGDMGRIKMFYEEEIEARIRKGGRNLRCFGIRDMDKQKSGWAFYVVDLDKDEVTRYLSADDVSDRFFHVLETIEPVDLQDEGIYKDLKKQKFIVTPPLRRFIDTCLDTIYTYPFPKRDERWVVDTIEDIFSKINYMGDATLFSLLLAQTNITPGRFQKVKDEDRWDEILGYIADSSFLDRWYLERLYVDGKIDVDWGNLQRLISVVSEIRRGNQEQKSEDSGWLSKEAPELVGKNLVYISPEAKVLGGLKPLLSGGLGVLAGELLVGFGDIGVNTHGVSLLYKKALVQEIDSNGNQIMHEVPVDYSVLPVRDTGVIVDVAVGDRLVKAKVWELREGRARVFLLDTDVRGNRPADKRITEVLYGGNRESPGLRMKQNIVLGRGAILAFEKMGIPVGFLHLNEAHTVISAYDLQKKRDNPLFKDTKIVFTTHTSVEFGLPKFDLRLGGLIDSDSGRVRNYFYKGNSLDFAHAALKMADVVNAVSQEHRDVTVRRWAQDYRDSVIGITNGVDVPYWQMPVWNWDNKESAKKELLEEVERRTGIRLREDALTIVVSRRITGYKHTTMVLEDLERLKQIIDTQDSPIQIIFAGNTHPGDKFGQSMIKRIVDITRQDRFKGKIVFVPNYNIEFAKLAVRGADIWLNNPEPGEEACATSYAKALKNGTIVISTYTGGPIEHMAGLPLDFDPEDYDVRNFNANGFFIQPYNPDTLYRCIEKARDLYYEYPDVWRKMMLNARKSQVDIRDVAREYVRKAFLVSLLKDRFREEVEIRNMQPAPRQEVEWKVTDDTVPEITVEVKLGSIRPEQVSVEIYYGGEGARSRWEYLKMKLDKVLDEENGVYLYKGKIPLPELIPGRYGFTTKVSLMGLRENAFTKWHSWQGNDGVIVIKEATIQELVNKFLSDDYCRIFWVSKALYSYLERLLIRNGRVDTGILSELYNAFRAHSETAVSWDEAMRVLGRFGSNIKAAMCMEDGEGLLDRIKSAAANNREFLIYLFKREPRPCRYNYVMAVNKKGELEMSEYNDRYREVYTEAEVIEKLRELGYIGGDGIIVIQPGDSFSAARTGVIPGASVFLHTHPRGSSTTPSDGDRKYWRKYSQYWFGRREYADLELAVQSLYKKEIEWVTEHAKRTARIAEIIAGRMGLGDELVRAIRIAALAHDLGKGCSGKMIEAANSSGPKREILDRHREEGLRMLENAGIVLDDVVRQAVLYHHDPWLAAGEYARLATEIVYLADEIDASQDVNRPYKKEAIDIGLLQSEFRRHYETRKISKSVYEAACELLTGHQPAFLDVIYEARGEGPSIVDLLASKRDSLREGFLSGRLTPEQFVREIIGIIRSWKPYVPPDVAQPEGEYRLGHLLIKDMTGDSWRNDLRLFRRRSDIALLARVVRDREARKKFAKAISAFLKMSEIEEWSSHEVLEVDLEIVRIAAGVADPDGEAKRNTRECVFSVLDGVIQSVRESGDPIQTALRLVVIGNALDSSDTAQRCLMRKEGDYIPKLLGTELVKDDFWARDDISNFRERIVGVPKNIVYVFDNAGEDVLDFVLINELLKMGHTVTLAGKSLPSSNDTTADDLRALIQDPRIRGLLGGNIDRIRIVATGSITTDTNLGRVSGEFREAWDKADLIIFKGQGNYYTVRDYKPTKDCLFVLKVKWGPEVRGRYEKGDNVAEYVPSSAVTDLQDRSHPAVKRGTETAMDLYRVTFDQRGEAVNPEEINPTGKYSKQHIEDVLEEVLRELVSEYGPGILSGLKEILITDREGHIGSQVDNRAVIDIDAFGNKRLVKEILEHEALHEILGLIIPDKDDLAEVVATWYSVRRFVNLGQAEKDEEIRVIRERIRDHKYAEFLEYIKSSKLQGDDLIGPVVAYLNFKGIETGDVERADRGFQEALRLFNDLTEAGRENIKRQVKEIEAQMLRVIRTLNGPRIIGKASSRVRRLIGFIVRYERLDLAEARDISKPRYIVVSEDREKNRLEDILRERYNIHVVTEIPKDAEFVVLVNPEDVGKWEGQELFYLPLPYMEQSLKLAAGMLLSGHEIARDYVEGFYNILLGRKDRKLSAEEVSNLFHKPWWILPEVSALTPDLIILREAISQLELEKSA